MVAVTPDVIKAEREPLSSVLKRRIPAWAWALMKNPVSITGSIFVLMFIVIALLAPVLAPPRNPAAPYQIPRSGFQAQPQPPAAGHPFGTTQGQYDIYYGVVWGTRTAFQVGIVVTLITVVIGGTIGAISAYAGGWFDEV